MLAYVHVPMGYLLSSVFLRVCMRVRVGTQLRNVLACVRMPVHVWVPTAMRPHTRPVDTYPVAKGAQNT